MAVEPTPPGPAGRTDQNHRYEELLTQNRIWRDRTRGIGVLSGSDAIALGLSGPVVRGSGVARDVSKDEPYAAYAEHRRFVDGGWMID